MKKFTYIALWLFGIMWTLSVWVANAVTNLEIYFLNNAGVVSHYTIMDRNIGASEVYNQDWDNQNTESYWYVYQRWNNYGFISTSSDFIEEFTGVQVPKSVRSGYSPSLYSSNIRYAGNDSWMWSWSAYDNIWWWAWDTASANWVWTTVNRKWPCPDGYYIPSVHDWSLIKNDWSTYANRSNRRTGFAYDLLLPPAGVRKNDSWVAKVFNVGQEWEYRTSSPRGNSNTSAYVMSFSKSIDGYNPPITDPIRSRSMGASLRCFRNNFKSDWSLNFHLNWWEKWVIAVNNGRFTSMSSPFRSVSIFEGWYTTPDFQTWTKLWVWSGTDGVTDLYAKWWCFDWYVLSGNACVGWTIVTFNSKCWVSQPSITVPYWTVLDFSWEVVNLSNWMSVTITWVADACPWEIFVWWSTGNEWDRPKRTIETLTIPDETNNITLHAIYRSNLTITFNATKNWWETDTGSISIPYGSIIDLSGYIASKGSWWVRTFLWWNTDPYATWVLSNIYKAENEDSDYITLYAIFRKDKFYVNFDTNGLGVTPWSQVVNRWDNIVDPWNLTAAWYEFQWWSDNEYLTTNFDFWDIPTDDVTLYAKWKAPWAKCYEWFEFDNNLWMCIKKNEWVIRVWLSWGIIISSWYSDFLEDLVSMYITWDYRSKMWNFEIAKNYYWVMLAENNVLDVYSSDSLDTSWNIVSVFERHGDDEKDLLFTMVTKASCRWNEPNCKFFSQNIEVVEWIQDWYNLKLFIDESLKQEVNNTLSWVVRADNIRIIFDPRVVVTFDSNWYWVSPEHQFLNKWSKIINPWSLSAAWYKFVGWSDNEYLMSIFDFNTVVNRDTKLYAKWEPIWYSYSCPEWQEYDKSVGLCKKPNDWVIRIWYQWDVEFSSWYSLFLDTVLLSGLDLGMSESEVEAFKKAFWILMAASEVFDWTDEIVIDEDVGIVQNGNFWLLDYYNKSWKLLFTVVVDMSWTVNNSSWWSIQLIIHTRSMYVNLANNVSSLDNLKLVPSTGINQYVQAYPSIAHLENLRIIFSDRMDPIVINNWYGGWWWHHQWLTNEDDKLDEHFAAGSQEDIQDNYDEFQQAYEFAFKNRITTMDTIEKADMEWWLTRIAMAKMLSNYAINVLGKKPENVVVPNFKDMNYELNEEYDFWVSYAYQLWIMWVNIPDNDFRPFDIVTRAEFATALSRLLFSTPDWDLYYSTHIEKLKSEWIIKDDNPDLQELRWYVMIMLMRSAKS